MTTKKPLYRFKLYPDSGDIVRSAITDYITCGPDTNKYYKFKLYGKYRYAYERNLDTLKNCSLYTFNPDVDSAYDIISLALCNKRYEYYSKYQSYKTIVSILKRPITTSNFEGKENN